jgi:DNA-binding beta-propeller fold protein YncE
VIDTRSNTVVATIPDLITPEQIAVAPDGRTVYVVEVLGHSVAASTRTRTSS